MAQIPTLDYIQVAGKVEVWVAVNLATYSIPGLYPFVPARSPVISAPTTNAGAYTTLGKLGELQDMVQPQSSPNMFPVHGDRQGGEAGNPIEHQYLGERRSIDMVFTRWDPDVYRLIEARGGLYQNGTVGTAPDLVRTGKVNLADMGALMQRDRSFRLLLYSIRDTRFVRNFPCCLLTNPFSYNTSVKHSILRLGVEAFRAPEGHWGTQVTGNAINGSTDLVTGHIENGDVTGLTIPLVPT